MKIINFLFTVTLLIYSFPALSDPTSWHSGQRTPSVNWMQTTATDEAVLNVGEKLVSGNGQLTLIMQSDGNLVLYPTSCIVANNCAWKDAQWNCLNGKPSQPPGQYYANLQWDGNLVVYRGTPGTKTEAICSTASSNPVKGEYFLWLSGDASNPVIYRGTPENNKGWIWDAKGFGAPVKKPTVRDCKMLCGPYDNVKGGRECSCRTEEGKQCFGC